MTKAPDAHHCNCKHVTRCNIFTHPSSKVQVALNNLMDAIAQFDDASGSSSTLSLESLHSTGIFTSTTYKESRGA